MMIDPEAAPRQEAGGKSVAPAKSADKERLAAALRENLRRRNAQRGGRRAKAAPSQENEAPESAERPSQK